MSTSTQPWHRLDARMLAVGPITMLGKAIIPLLIVVFVGGFERGRVLWAGAAACAVIGYGILRWLTTKYRISPTHVELHAGWLFRKQTSIPRDRVRTVDLTSELAHRIFGLSVVKVGTGESAESDLALDAVNAAEAERLRRVLLERGAPDAVAVEETAPAVPLAAFQWGWLWLAPLTLAGLAAIGALIGAGWQFVDELGLDEIGLVKRLLGLAEDAGGADTIAVAVLTGLALLVVLNVLGSLLIYLVQYWGFSLSRQADGTLRIARGLLTTRSVSIEERRLRGVEVSEPWLLRLASGAKATAVSTGQTGEGSALLLPPVPKKLVDSISAEVLGVTPSPTTAPLRRHPRAALRRLLVEDIVLTPIVAIVLAVLAYTDVLPNWPWLVALALIPLGVAHGFAAYRNLGHTLTPGYLVSRHGAVLRTTVALQRNGIIGWTLTQTLFQRRSGLMTLTAVTAAGSGHYNITDMAAPDAITLADQAIPDLLRPFLHPPTP